MKALFISVLAAGLLFASCGQSNSSSAATTGTAAEAPVMKFDKDIHDFGKIKPGGIVTYDFKFTNTGKSPLIISDGYATCGCTKPSWPKTPIKPGDTGIVHIVFDSRGKSGLQDKLITITANTNPAQNQMHLIGEVTPL